MIEEFANHFSNENIDLIAGIESRGFIIGTPLALKLGKGFVPIRKNGKLPAPTFNEKYKLEYGTDILEIHKDAISNNQRVLIVDDLIATGGTVEASSKLIKKAGGVIVGYAFLIELIDLNGTKNLKYPVFSLVKFEGQ